ncbi:MAG: hypothetical protein KDJ29_05075 [Hyphomicrobiales bacterium]|nr:hypothetical protein [Hyphomicrobiales bacterium]
MFDLNGVSASGAAGPVTELPLGYFERHLHFVTFHVRPGAYGAKDGFSSYNAQPIFAAFKSWYLSMCRNLLGPKFNKKPLLQPFIMAFLDVEGSRYGQAAKAFEIPHIHALMLVHPKVENGFKALMGSARLVCTEDPRISKVEIEPFKDDGRGSAPIMTYAAKYPRSIIENPRHETPWWCYPDVKPETFAFLGTAVITQQNASAS